MDNSAYEQYGEYLDEVERAYQEHRQRQQPNYGKANREWQEGDIDWSAFEEWKASIMSAREQCGPYVQKKLDAALAKVNEGVMDLMNYDPRYVQRGK